MTLSPSFLSPSFLSLPFLFLFFLFWICLSLLSLSQPPTSAEVSLSLPQPFNTEQRMQQLLLAFPASAL